MIVEITEELFEELDKRFEIIKDCSRRNIFLPEEFEADKIDRDFYISLKALWENYRRRNISYEEAVAEGKNYRNLYVSKKQVEKLHYKNIEEDHRRRMISSQLAAKLHKGDLNTIEAFDALIAYLAALTNEPSAKIIAKNLVVSLGLPYVFAQSKEERGF